MDGDARGREGFGLASEVILVGTFSLEGLGLVIRDRLIRAAEGRVIEVDQE